MPDDIETLFKALAADNSMATLSSLEDLVKALEHDMYKEMQDGRAVEAKDEALEIDQADVGCR